MGKETRPKKAAAPREKPRGPSRRRLSWKEGQELEALPVRIEELEAEQTGLHAEMADPAFFKQEAEVIAAANRRLAELEQDLAETYARWEELESMAD